MSKAIPNSAAVVVVQMKRRPGESYAKAGNLILPSAWLARAQAASPDVAKRAAADAAAIRSASAKPGERQ